MPEKNRKTIAFVNGKPAACGCQISFSSGHGEYSDVHYLKLCALHGDAGFGPVEVARDEDGWWWHPALNELGDSEDPALYKAWVAERNLELKGWHIGDELDQHPSFEGACHCNGWEPASPGPDWFLLGIWDTEDGAYVQWARRIRA